MNYPPADFETLCRYFPSPVGELVAFSDGVALTGLHFAAPGDPLLPEKEPQATIFDQTAEYLRIYFSGRQPKFTPPLAPHGTPFRERVWAELLTIDWGCTTTYGELAVRLARQSTTGRMAAQAIGNAVHANLIAIIIPCHRVIGAGGQLVGYGGGLERKRFLLNLERRQNHF